MVHECCLCLAALSMEPTVEPRVLRVGRVRMNDGKLEIAILAWGSLMWEVRPEFDEHHEEWSLDGPVLKVEFSRISTSRQNALTLVIDKKYGVATAVAWCLSKRQSIEDAICDLRCREGTTHKNIGCVCMSVNSSPSLCPTIKDWAVERHLDAVIWTALESNFEKKKGTSFSVLAAVEHIKKLDACGQAKAAEYVWRAPAFIHTPVRDALQQEPWFSHSKPSV